MSRLVAVCLSTVLFTQRIFAASSWEELESFSQSASILATHLSKKIVARLKAENSTTIFISRGNCLIKEVEKNEWCRFFWSTLEMELSQSQIQFLPDDKKDQIREQIAEELSYQNSSMHVDPLRAVEIGKQNAVQAMVSVDVVQSEGKIVASAQSINIKSGTVNLTEHSTLNLRSDISTISSGKIAKYSLVSVGVAGMIWGGIRAYDAEERANESYSSYKNTQDPTKSKELKTKTKKFDREASLAYSGAAAGLAVVLWGLSIKTISHEHTTYSYSLANKIEHPSLPSAVAWAPFFTRVDLGMELNFRF